MFLLSGFVGADAETIERSQPFRIPKGADRLLFIREGISKPERVTFQEEIRAPDFGPPVPVMFAVPVYDVADQGVIRPTEVTPNLVVPSRHGIYPHERIPRSFEPVVFPREFDRPHSRINRSGFDRILTLFGERRVDLAVDRTRSPHDRKVSFFDFAGHK